MGVDRDKNLKNKRAILDSLDNSKDIDTLEFQVEHTTYQDRLNKFIKMAQVAGAKVYKNSPNFNIQNLFKDVKIIIDTKVESKIGFKNIQNVDLTIIKAKFGVAENGAVWIEWQDSLYPRALLTISKYLAIFLDKEEIVDNLPQAYELIDLSKVDYGVFLSGPSKTADIEQSLVIGAHGALSMAIILS